MDEEEELFNWAADIYESEPSDYSDTPVTIYYSIDKDPATGDETTYPSEVQIEGL